MYYQAEHLEDYLAGVENAPLLHRVLILVASFFPEQVPYYFDNGQTFSGVAFGRNPQPTPGYEEAGFLMFSAQKNFIGLYFEGNGKKSLGPYLEGFPRHRLGKGCLRLPNSHFLVTYQKELENFLSALAKEATKVNEGKGDLK